MPSGALPRSLPAPFRFIINDVFRLLGRGTAVMGDHAAEGEFLSGEVIEVVRGGVVVLTSTASSEIHARPGAVSLVLPGLDADVMPGDEVRCAL